MNVWVHLMGVDQVNAVEVLKDVCGCLEELVELCQSDCRSLNDGGHISVSGHGPQCSQAPARRIFDLDLILDQYGYAHLELL